MEFNLDEFFLEDEGNSEQDSSREEVDDDVIVDESNESDEEDEGNDDNDSDSNDIQDVDENDEDSLTGAKLFYNYLTENKYLDPDDNFDGSESALKEKMVELPYRVLKSTLESIEPEKRQVVEKLLFNPNAKLEDVSDYIKTLNSDKFEDKYLAKNYILSNLSTDLEQDEVEKIVEKLTEEEIIEKANKLKAKKTEAARAKFEQDLAQREKEIEENIEKERTRTKEFLAYIETNYSNESDVILKTLDNETLNAYMSNVKNNPKALAQFALFLSSYDEKAKEFKFGSSTKPVKAPVKSTSFFEKVKSFSGDKTKPKSTKRSGKDLSDILDI